MERTTLSLRSTLPVAFDLNILSAPNVRFLRISSVLIMQRLVRLVETERMMVYELTPPPSPPLLDLIGNPISEMRSSSSVAKILTLEEQEKMRTACRVSVFFVHS